MKKLFLAGSLLAIPVFLFAQLPQQTPAPDPVLYGVVAKNILNTAPYSKWFVANYDAYQPDASVMQSLKKTDTKGISVEIFLGTWCGDSRREVPRFMKLLEGFSFPEKNVKIITMGGQDSLYKQSPQHEEEGKGIFRVPVFIIYKNGVEINRINEFPVLSLEKDLLAILNHQSYFPNYRSFAAIRGWLADGTLWDKNTSINGLAAQIRALVGNERELNSLGYLLLRQGKKEEALKIFQVNSSLYPESAVVLSSLGEGYYRSNDLPNAVRLLERSLELNKDPQQVKPILNILYLAKGTQ